MSFCLVVACMAPSLSMSLVRCFLASSSSLSWMRRSTNRLSSSLWGIRCKDWKTVKTKQAVITLTGCKSQNHEFGWQKHHTGLKFDKTVLVAMLLRHLFNFKKIWAIYTNLEVGTSWGWHILAEHGKLVPEPIYGRGGWVGALGQVSIRGCAALGSNPYPFLGQVGTLETYPILGKFDKIAPYFREIWWSQPIIGKFDKITPYFRETGLSKSTL